MSAKSALAMSRNMAFADFLGQRLAKRGWTVKQLAEAAGVNCTSAFRNLVAGRARAAPKTLARLAPALGVEVSELSGLYGPAAVKRRKARLREQSADVAETPRAKPQQVTLPKFAMTLAADGTMRVTLDLSELRPEAAFGLVEYLRANGLLSKENT
jgi:transcriptional regulator with XRE-family HTH domain